MDGAFFVNRLLSPTPRGTTGHNDFDMPASGHAPPEAVVAVSVVFTVMAVVVVAMRVYARLGVGRNAGVDDAFIGAALVSMDEYEEGEGFADEWL